MKHTCFETVKTKTMPVSQGFINDNQLANGSQGTTKTFVRQIDHAAGSYFPLSYKYVGQSIVVML